MDTYWMKIIITNQWGMSQVDLVEGTRVPKYPIVNILPETILHDINSYYIQCFFCNELNNKSLFKKHLGRIVV